MEISELNRDELIALVGLAKLVIMSDRILTQEEKLKFDALIEKIGTGLFRELLDLFDQCCADLDSFREFLMKVEKPEARELLYRIIFDLATVDSVNYIESDLLDWLAAEWDLKIGIETANHDDKETEEDEM